MAIATNSTVRYEFPTRGSRGRTACKLHESSPVVLCCAMRLGWLSLRIFFGGLFVLAILVAPDRYEQTGNALQQIGVAMYTVHQETGGWPTGNFTLIEPGHSMINRGLIVIVPNVF
jgi:hypothetical protein